MDGHNIKYLRIILTNSCNLNCEGCHKEGQIYHNKMSEFDLMKIIAVSINAGIRKIKLMGGEPTLYENLPEIILRIKNLDNSVDLSLVSNGTANIKVYEECFIKGLDRLNLSIHGFERKYFIMNTRSNAASWKKIRDNLELLCKLKKINKLNYVLKRGCNENDLEELISWLSHFPGIRLDILNYLTGTREGRHLTYSMKEIEKILNEKFGIVNKKKVDNAYSLESTHVSLNNGVVVNLKTSELRHANFLKSCRDCEVKEFCTEGICAVRLCTDYRIQPCLFRNDNCFLINCNSEDLEHDISEYFNKL